MKLEKISLVDLNPAEYNPRKISDQELLKLENSINEFGLVDPIIINLKNNKIIGGHQRYEALYNKYTADNDFQPELNLIRLGDIGWVFEDTELKISSEAQEKALNLALNKISGEWDTVKLQPLLEEIQLSNLDISLTGFDEIELGELNTDIEKELTDNTEIIEDEYTAEAPEETEIQHGDLFRLGDHVLICGDSTNEEDIKKLLTTTGGEIDLILTDPPYGIDIVQNDGTVGTTSKIGFGKGGAPGIVKAKTYKKITDDDKPFDPSLILNLDKKSIIWGANNFSSKLPDSPKWLCWFKKPEDAPDNGFSDIELAWTNIEGKQCKLYKHLWSGLLREGDRKTELKERVHPTQKPVGLLANILTDFSEPGQNILDLYGGSGSTLIACEQTNRQCYMMELDPHYCQVIIDRWEEFTGMEAEKIN